MDPDERPPSICLLDHSYLNGDGSDQGRPAVDTAEESSLLDLNSAVLGRTVVQLQDGSITIPNEDGLIQLEDGRLFRLEDYKLIEVEANDVANSEDDGIEISGSALSSEDNFVIPSGGCYIQLGDRLLYIENEAENNGEAEADDGNSELTEEMQWVIMKEEPDVKPQTENSSFLSKGFSGNFLEVGGKMYSNVVLNLPETTNPHNAISSIKVESVSDGDDDDDVDNKSDRGDETEDAEEISTQSDMQKSASSYSCKDCSIQFACRKDFLNHRKTHQKPFLCDICGQGFLNINSFKSHKEYHEAEESSFKCFICGIDFPSLNLIKEHLKLHRMSAEKDLEKSYQCDLCDAKFIYRSNLCRHRKAHTKDKAHVCEVCGKGFYQKSNLQSHQQIHCIFVAGQNGTGVGRGCKTRRPKQFSCDLCGKGFANLTGLKNHDAMHTGNRPHICPAPGCGKSFALMSCLKTHLSTIHSEVKHLCQVCGKNYRNANYLKLHLKIHSGKKDFHCDICSKAFIDNPSLKLHLRTHTGERPYGCKVCGKSFAQQAHLKTHIRTHTGEKPYDCSVCGKPFRQLSNKIEHERIHKKHVY